MVYEIDEGVAVAGCFCCFGSGQSRSLWWAGWTMH